MSCDVIADATVDVTDGHSEVKPAPGPALSQVDICPYNAVRLTDNERTGHSGVCVR